MKNRRHCIKIIFGFFSCGILALAAGLYGQQWSPDESAVDHMKRDIDLSLRLIGVHYSVADDLAQMDVERSRFSSFFLTDAQKMVESERARTVAWEGRQKEYTKLRAAILNNIGSALAGLKSRALQSPDGSVAEYLGKVNASIDSLSDLRPAPDFLESRPLLVEFNVADFVRIVNGESVDPEQGPLFQRLDIGGWTSDDFRSVQLKMDAAVPNWYSSDAFLAMLSEYLLAKANELIVKQGYSRSEAAEIAARNLAMKLDHREEILKQIRKATRGRQNKCLPAGRRGLARSEKREECLIRVGGQDFHTSKDFFKNIGKGFRSAVRNFREEAALSSHVGSCEPFSPFVKDVGALFEKA